MFGAFEQVVQRKTVNVKNKNRKKPKNVESVLNQV